MKRLSLSLFVIIVLIWPAQTLALSSVDVALIYRRLQIITNHFNNIRDSESLKSIVPTDNAALLTDLTTAASGKKIELAFEVTSITEQESEQVRVDGDFTAKIQNGNKTSENSGAAYFLFQKINNRWQLKDTNIHKQMGLKASSSGITGFLWWLLKISIVLGAAVLLWWLRRTKRLRLPGWPKLHKPTGFVPRKHVTDPPKLPLVPQRSAQPKKFQPRKVLDLRPTDTKK